MTDPTLDPNRQQRIVSLWSAGSYEDLGALFEPISRDLTAELELAGQRVLDAGTGTGNTAIAAAAAGATIDACDLTPRLLDVARDRAIAAGVDIAFVEADLLALPYEDDTFDVVLSTFGAFTVDDPTRCARELVRVCRPGGRVVTTAWGNQGLFATSMTVIARELPEVNDPSGPHPHDWAELDGVRGFLTGIDVRVDVEHRTAWFRFASLPAAFDLFEVASGPYLHMRAAIEERDPDGWHRVRRDVVAAWEPLARPVAGGGVELPAHYGVATIIPA
jgi:SAM-dependent methyltransferase